MIFYTVLRHTNIALYFIAIEYGSNHTHKCVVDVSPYIPTYPSMFFVFFIVLNFFSDFVLICFGLTFISSVLVFAVLETRRQIPYSSTLL